MISKPTKYSIIKICIKPNNIDKVIHNQKSFWLFIASVIRKMEQLKNTYVMRCGLNATETGWLRYPG